MKRLASIPNDKLLHSFYGTAIYAVIALYSPIVALVCVMGIALGKEIYDMTGKGTPDSMDVIATVGIPTVLCMGDLFRC